MADYTKSIQNGTMMIRDTGGNVEFWFQTGSSTWNNQQDWGWSLDGGGWNMGVFKLSTGGAWHHIGTIYVGPGANRQVGMRIVDEGLGWPTTDFFVTVSRASAPNPPGAPVLTVLSGTSIRLAWGGDGANNGSGITDRELWGSGDTTPRNVIQHTSAYTWTGLAPGTTYYFWAKNANAIGWSGFSARASAKTWDVPAAPSIPALSSITNNSVVAKFTDGANNGASIDTRQLGWGTSSSAPTSTMTSDGSDTITGLKPGTTYYIWARTHNSVGWSAWSARATIKTLDVPSAPSSVTLSDITQTSMRAVFTANGDGGSAITGYEIGYGTSSTAPQSSVSSNKNTVISGLQPGTTYYFWARAKNAYGWGPYSAVKSAQTVAGAWVLMGTTWKQAVPYVNVNGVWKPAQVWAKIAGVWKETM